MAGVRKPTPLEAFEANMHDAHHLVALAEGLTNARSWMRAELRQRIGEALRIPRRDWGNLDCLENEQMFLLFKPKARLGRADLVDRRPLLRQSLVAACAATETYLADRAVGQLGRLTKSTESASDRLTRLSMTVGDWLYIEQNYTRRRAGLHNLVIERQVRETASTSSNKVGELLAFCGVANPQRQLDHHRGAARGETYAFLDRVTQRRNKIVHTGDREGRRRAPLSLDEVKADLAGLESVVQAIEKLLDV